MTDELTEPREGAAVEAPPWTIRDKIDHARREPERGPGVSADAVLPGLSPTHKAVAQIVGRPWPKGWCYLAPDRIAFFSGLSLRAVGPALADLVAKGWAEHKVVTEDGRRQHWYRIAPTPDVEARDIATDEEIDRQVEGRRRADRERQERHRNARKQEPVTASVTVTAHAGVTAPDAVTDGASEDVTASPAGCHGTAFQTSRQALPDVTASPAVDPEWKSEQPEHQPDLPTAPRSGAGVGGHAVVDEATDPAGLVSNDGLGDPDATIPEPVTEKAAQLLLVAEPVPTKRPKTGAPSTPVRDAYQAAYQAAFGSVPPMGAADNSACLRLVQQMGAEAAVRLVGDVYAVDDRVRERYASIRAMASNPAAVLAAVKGRGSKLRLNDNQLSYARSLAKSHPSHPIVVRLKSEQREPTHEEFQELIAHDKRSGQHRDGPRQQGMMADALKNAQDAF